MLRIDGIEITAKAVIRVSQIQMERRRLAELDVSYAFGEGLVGEDEALVVITEGQNGAALSVQFRKEAQAAAQGSSNFNHGPCYEQGPHEKTKQGRAWCRKQGPASKDR